MPWHRHTEARLVVVLSGSFEEQWKGNSLVCSSGSVIFRPAGQLHRERFSECGSYVSMPMAATYFSQAVCGHSDRMTTLVHTMRRELRWRDSFSSISLQGLVLQIVAELGRRDVAHERRAPRWISDLCEFIGSNPLYVGSLESLAARVGRHPAHVARAFHEHVGTTIGQYARMKRVEFARNLLETTDVRIADISAQAGFFDQAHLTRSFRLAFGMTPSEYRQLRRRALS